MLKAYDIMLQSEVSSDLAAKNRGFEPYRYECACCGEEVYVAAAFSTSMVSHFRHRNGNNDVECENYLGQFGAISIDSHSRKSTRERAEFYFEKTNKTFNLGLRFSESELKAFQLINVAFEISMSSNGQAFYTLPINNMNFAPDTLTLIPISRFAKSYFLSNTLSVAKRKYDFIKSDGKPIFFKMIGNETGFKARLVRGEALYTNVPYFVAYISQYSIVHTDHIPNGISVDDEFCFETMGRNFLGKVMTIKNKTTQIDDLVSHWGYHLEASETLVLLWPPAELVDDASIMHTNYAYLYSSFELQAHGNINIHADDLKIIANGVSKVSIKMKTKVFKKNAEIILDKKEKYSLEYDEIPITVVYTSTFTVPDDARYLLFNCEGVKPLSKGQSIFLTSNSEIRHYYFGYLTTHIYRHQSEEIRGELLLNDILVHYKRTETYDINYFSSHLHSKIASQYIEKCEISSLINSVVKEYIEEEKI